MPPPRIYLAGPEVFLPDALAVGARKAALCAARGLAGVFPMDAGLDLAGLAKPEAARRISEANEALMHSCAGLIANLTPFRGVSMDSGTAFEVGYMRALGRPVLGYTNTVADYRVRAEIYRGAAPSLPEFDHPGSEIEDFDGAENLMIEVAITASGGSVVRIDAPAGSEMREMSGFAACVEQMAAILLR